MVEKRELLFSRKTALTHSLLSPNCKNKGGGGISIEEIGNGDTGGESESDNDAIFKDYKRAVEEWKAPHNGVGGAQRQQQCPYNKDSSKRKEELLLLDKENEATNALAVVIIPPSPSAPTPTSQNKPNTNTMVLLEKSQPCPSNLTNFQEQNRNSLDHLCSSSEGREELTRGIAQSLAALEDTIREIQKFKTWLLNPETNRYLDAEDRQWYHQDRIQPLETHKQKMLFLFKDLQWVLTEKISNHDKWLHSGGGNININNNNSFFHKALQDKYNGFRQLLEKIDQALMTHPMPF